MTLWPRHEAPPAAREDAAPASWAGLSALAREAAETPPIDLADARGGKAAAPPPIEVALSRPASKFRRGPRSRVLAVLALLASTGLHAAALAFFLDRMSRAGVEAETHAVSVQIVLEAPPEPVVAASGGTPAADEHGAEAAEAAENAVMETADGERAESRPPEASLPEAERLNSPAEDRPADMAREAIDPIVEQRAGAEGPTAVTAPPDPADELTPPLTAAAPAEPRPEEQAVEPAPPEEEAMAAMPTPETDIPLPSPRPSYAPPKAKPPAENKAVAGAEPAGTAARKPVKAQAKASGSKQAETARNPASAAGSAAARGGASAGEKAKYGQKLLSHVERHKRYPEAAARQRLAGATKLAITIDRAGRLASARVAGGSGHAILDEAALAAARRAAPYPRPPEGIGGGTFSFAVTMRFKR